MSQCDCTWRQEVKGLAAWKVEFEENLSEELPCYYSQSKVMISQIKQQCKKDPTYLSCISPIYRPSSLPLYFLLVNSSLFSSPHTGFHSISQMSMLTAHGLLSFPVTRAEQSLMSACSGLHRMHGALKHSWYLILRLTGTQFQAQPP